MKSRKSTRTQNNRVLGIDPGFGRVGIAVLERKGSQESLLCSECIETDKKIPHEERLLIIGTRIREVIREFAPTSLALEKLFFNQNTSTALKVAEARGVILFEAAHAGLSVYEYSPQDVKIAVTGYGKADKTQMEGMTRKLVRVSESEKKLDDELDAIAVGICHLATAK